LDLSLSIVHGNINCFGVQMVDFQTSKRSLTRFYREDNFNSDVSESGEIPAKNKRETFRMLKHVLLTQNNISESVYFKVLEKNALKNELVYEMFKRDDRRWLTLL